MSTNCPLSPLTLMDGGLGTTLADRYSITFSECTPLWSSHLLLTPSGIATLKDVQTAFANAGADIILTATYQASFIGFTRSGVEATSSAAKLMRESVAIAKSALETSGRKGKVALSLGAYGASMVPAQEYSGLYDEEHLGAEALKEWHFERIAAFLPAGKGDVIGDEGEGEEREVCWGGVDLVAFETLPRLDEVVAVRQVMAMANSRLEGADRKEFWISCVFPGEARGLPDGSDVKHVVEAMLGAGKGERPMGVGINCTRASKVEELVLEFEQEVKSLIERGGMGGDWPALVLYPDGTRGEVYNTATKEWVKTGEDESKMPWDEEIFGIVQRSRERRLWKEILVGGCCKTTPDDIGKLRKRIDEL